MPEVSKKPPKNESFLISDTESLCSSTNYTFSAVTLPVCGSMWWFSVLPAAFSPLSPPCDVLLFARAANGSDQIRLTPGLPILHHKHIQRWLTLIWFAKSKRLFPPGKTPDSAKTNTVNICPIGRDCGRFHQQLLMLGVNVKDLDLIWGLPREQRESTGGLVSVSQFLPQDWMLPSVFTSSQCCESLRCSMTFWRVLFSFCRFKKKKRHPVLLA